MFSIKAAALAVLSFSSFLVDAAPAPIYANVTDTNMTDRADSSGYKNVVYFTNWCVPVYPQSSG